MRIEKLKKIMSDISAQAAFITSKENIFYFSGFTGSSAYLYITENKNYIITDFRYVEQAKIQCEKYEVVELKSGFGLPNFLFKQKEDIIAFEDENITFSFYNNILKKAYGKIYKPLGNKLRILRAVKEEKEIEILKKAAKIGDEAFKDVLKYIKVGVSEREISLELEYKMKRLEAENTSFDIIVASGKRSALPHGVASDKLIEEGDFVTMDFGCIYKGYCSDMTRTVCVGKAKEKQKEIYDIVLKAQKSAMDYIKPGNTCREPDYIARKIIADEGYGNYFGHSLGHGVGVEIHEYPSLSPNSENILLEKNMIVTDEPGIYIPNEFGVRIEDLIVVTENGCETLSHSPKELIEL